MISCQPPLIPGKIKPLTLLTMDIEQLKAAIARDTGIAVPVLMMVRQLDQNTEEPQPWLSHWDNANRLRITMHEDIFNQIKADKTKQGLAYKKELVTATPERDAYTRIVVITPQNIEATF